MSREIEEIQKLMNAPYSQIDFDVKFEEYSKIYAHSNEYLKEYIKDLDGKKVLCVTGSGDHLLNSIIAGAKEVDTFDINRFAVMYQELKLYAIKYLKPTEAYIFLCLFDKDLYKKFSKHLPDNLRLTYDYLFDNYPVDTILYKFFEEFTTSLEFNNYNSLSAIQELKDKISKIKRQHFVTSLYSLPDVLTSKYDVIYLSNILDYENNFTKYFDIVRRLREGCLNEGGELYYNYLWGKPRDIKIEKCFKSRKSKRYISPKEIEANQDIIYQTDKVVVKSTYTETYDLKDTVAPDILLRVKKER